MQWCSLNQKEAYRRWVCSTLVPYFAETSDIMKPPEILTTTMQSASILSTSSVDDANSSSRSLDHPSDNNTTMASNLTTSQNTATLSNNNNNNGTDFSSDVALKTVTSNFITNRINNELGRQYRANNYVQHQHHQQPEQHQLNKRNIRFNRKLTGNNSNSNNNNTSITAITTAITTASSNSNININKNNKIKDFNYEVFLIHHKNQTQQQQLQHPTHLIASTPAFASHEIVNHNSWFATPPNYLSSPSSSIKPTSGRNSHHKSTNKRRKRSDNSTMTSTAIKADAIANKPSMSLFASSPSSSSSTSTLHQTHSQKEQLEQQSLNFISTANNEDSFSVKSPAITKLLKRSTRKEFEFRKRRRIRPCLSVCQTVEQRCPYLLPADRAPSMPTQYAGEPTFLCLDYNIAETEEQLRKASHGTNDCCYTYCSNSADGICTYCDDMWQQTEIDKAAEALSRASERRVFNITMKTKGQEEAAAQIRVESKIQQSIGEEKSDLKMSTVAITVRNDTALENATSLAERLQFYAFCDGVFYYDADTGDMPEKSFSENCQRLPAVQSRCSIPYYASNYISSAEMLGSYRKHNEARTLLIWLSTLVCLWSCYSARSLRMKRCNEIKTQHQPSHQNPNQQPKFNNTAFEEGRICRSCQTRDIMQIKEKHVEKIIEIWYDYRESKVFIVFCLDFRQEGQKCLVKKKSLRVRRHLRRIQRWSRNVPINLKILKMPSLILLISCKEILLLLLKKRQKLRKRKVPIVAGGGMRACHEINWSILKRVSSTRGLKMIPKICSRNKYKIHYYYYYCSRSPVFSCSCTKTIKYNFKNLNENYIKLVKYNLKTCNFNNEPIHDNRNNNMMINKINYNKVSIIKFNTTTTTIYILTFKYNKRKSNNKFISYKIITFIIISYNIYYKKRIFISLSLRPNCSQHYYYNYYKNYSNYSNYYNNYVDYFKSNKTVITHHDVNIVLLKTLTFALTLTLAQTSTVTIASCYLRVFKLATISEIIPTPPGLIITMSVTMILQMLIKLFLLPLFFKSFLKMKCNNNHNNNNNNHHMKNITTSKLKISFKPKSSHNSEKGNYRYFYYYNFNIYDWWQRRRWRRQRQPPLSQKHSAALSKSCFSYSGQSLFLLNDSRSPESCFTHVLL